MKEEDSSTTWKMGHVTSKELRQVGQHASCFEDFAFCCTAAFNVDPQDAQALSLKSATATPRFCLRRSSYIASKLLSMGLTDASRSSLNLSRSFKYPA